MEPAGGVVSRPGLFERLQLSARVAVTSAPAGSGKTMLLRSWISEAALAERVGWPRCRYRVPGSGAVRG
ncbi:MAG: hypothetical protein ABSB59_09185 [Streptosporangiaceae bacterium]